MSIAALALTAAIQTAPPPSPGPTMVEASASLQGKTQCISFTWLSDGKGSPKAAISVPVRINGKSVPLQLDTGADATILYGRAADRAGWGKPGRTNFRAASFAIGSTVIDRPTVHINAAMEEDAQLIGTLGLPELMGRIAVIDYPHQRFCLFAEADLPAPLASATYVRGDLRNTKFFVPVAVDTFQSDAVVFDTGSSLLPLSVDLPTWTKLTGRSGARSASVSIKGSAWGKPVTLSGAPATGAMMLGKLNLGRPLVFTDADHPNEFAGWPFRADGVLGNASLWDGLVILDMTARMRFGYIR